MPNKLITLERAHREIARLKKYVNLIENYDDSTVDKWIIKQYAITNSIKKIEEEATERNLSIDGKPIDRAYITKLINGNVMDELHRIVRLGYRQKIRPNKRKY